MALISCPECGSNVSEKAHKCPSCGHIIRTPKRGPIGFIIKWAFILFNLLMIWWLISYFASVGELASNNDTDAEKAGTAIGATLGTGLIASIWVVGDIILGILVLFTRPKT